MTQTATPTPIPAPACCADFDRSGTVSIADISYEIRRFGSIDPVGDLNGDSKVTVADILFVIHQFAKHC